MKPAPFDYLRAASLDEALDALARFGGDARPIAGGQSLLAMLNTRVARPKVLVDILPIAGLRGVRLQSGAMVVSAAVRQAEVMAQHDLARQQPLLAQALPFVGHHQTRARGTVCGSVAHADPSAEIPLCLVALDGEVRLRSKARARSVKASAFFVGMMTTARAENEIIEAVVFPSRASGAGYAFREVARRHGDFAIVAAAAHVDATSMCLAIGGVADTPQRITWPRLTGSALDDALNGFAWSLEARDDLHASARYRRDLVRRIGRAVIEEADSCRC